MFTELKLIDENISQIQKELKGSFVKPEVLLHLADQIDAIYAFIQRMDNPDAGPQFRAEIEKHKTALIELFGRWQTLFIDAEITQIAEDAQQLSEQGKNPQVQKKLRALGAKIQAIYADEGLSLENQLMVTLARRFIAKGLDLLHKIPSPPDLPPMSVDEITEMTLHLLDIGRHFYDGRIGCGLKLYNALIPRHKLGIKLYFDILEGDEKDFISSDFAAIKAAS
ncbi:MAG TPA: hypothetical protein PLO43_02695, partial [Chlamydiales bacterium]|nr:hypothetical protein [Chlamydiales bacterium]